MGTSDHTCLKPIYKWYDGIKQDVKDKGWYKHSLGESGTELRRFWYSILYFLISFYCVGMTNVIAQKRGVMYNVEGPIADLGFDAFYAFTNKLYSYNPWICDQFTYILVAICAVWILIFTGRRDKGYQRRIVIYKRWLFLVSFCFNMRSITTISTVLPRPWQDDQEWTFCKNEFDSGSFSSFSSHSVNRLIINLYIIHLNRIFMECGMGNF